MRIRSGVDSSGAAQYGISMRVVDTFSISRGLVVLLDQTTELPVARRLIAAITHPDGTETGAIAFKERLLRYKQAPLECDCFLLLGLSKDDVAIDSVISFEVEE